jgi:hypothetical protein
MAIALTSKTVAIAILPSNWVFSHSLGVFSYDDFTVFSFLQSTIHNIWAWQYGSSMKSDLRYTPSVCFETFPLPLQAIEKQTEEEIYFIGKKYYEVREILMRKAKIGLTKLYNLFHNEKYNGELIVLVQKLRNLHIQLDTVILNAYEWNDISLKHDFYELEHLPEKDRTRFGIHPDSRKEILTRLLKLNHTNYTNEQNDYTSRQLAKIISNNG